MGFLEAVCDRIIILHKGKIVAEGKVPELMQHFSIQQWFDVWVETQPSVGEILETQGNLYRLRISLDDISKLDGKSIRQLSLETSALESIMNEVANVES
jgi:ABC-type multidrug transport system ATPase subunit